MINERGFKGVWIPREIWEDSDLGWSEKLLLVEIHNLDNEEGCFASNEYLADFFKLSKDRVSKLISALKNKGYITVNLIRKKNNNSIDKRLIRVDKMKFNGIVESTYTYRRKQLEGIVENTYTPIGENNEDNNTVYNNTFNNTSNIVKNNKSFEILEFWNSLKIKVHKKTPSEKIVKKALNDVGEEKLFEAFRNYKKILNDSNFYFKYIWDLETFLKKQRGKPEENFKRFLEGGDIFDNYQVSSKNKNKSKRIEIQSSEQGKFNMYGD